MAKVLVMTPTAGGTVWDESADGVANNMVNAALAGHDVHKASQRGYQIGPNRTRIADKAVNGGYDYVFMVDSDVVLPDDALVTLLEDEVDVVLGFYAHQGSFMGKTCLCRENRGFHDQLTATEIAEMRERGVTKFKIRGGGMGCALIKTDVFRRIKYPFFKWVDYDDRHGTLSEDLYFCVQCENAGIAIWADARIGCGHFFRYKQGVM